MKKAIFTFLIGFLFVFFAKPTYAALPPNFQKNLIQGTGLSGPSGFEFAPDGRIFVLERTGEVKVIKNGQLLGTDFTDFPSAASGDRGLIGVTFDPNFFQNHYVYFYYTDQNDLHNKLVRLDASTDTATSNPLILYQTQDQSFQLHVGGTVRFGPDGKIYLSIGDNGYFPNAQDLTNPHGKILRMNPDGTTPSDNPFFAKTGLDPFIWAYGFRNPFRFSFDAKTNNLYVGDVGEATWEEVNKVMKGGNYGWPNCEGYCSPTNPNYIDPIYDWNHNGGSAAVMVGPVYYGQMFPSTYQGKLFFGDYAEGWIKTMTLDSNGNNAGVQDFDTNAGSVVDMHVSPIDGSLYYITYYPAALYQIVYSTGNHFPVPSAQADVTSGATPLTVHFSSSGTYDPDNDSLTYYWDFGDGTTSTDPNPVKTYTNSGQYIVNLSVSDGTNTAKAVPIVIQAGLPPHVTITTPTNGTTYKAGDTITYAVDAEDGAFNDLPSSAVSVTIVFHHQTHIHPFLGPIVGNTGTFTIPTTGEVSADTWYEIDATATDSHGLSTTATTNIYPVTSTMTFQTDPPNLQITLDGQPTQTTATISGVVNFQRTISAPVTQVVNGITYTFNHWSDGATLQHTIVTPATDTTYTAYFDSGSGFSGEYFSNSDLSGTPTLTRNDQEINFDWGDTGSPDASIPHNTFSVRWTKQQYFAAGTYTFTTTVDDGVRLYIDGNLVIDHWIGEPTTTYSVDQTLSQGTHEIKMEYFQSFGGAVAKLSWDYDAPSPTPTPTITITPTPTTEPTPTTVPTVTPTTVPTPTDTPSVTPTTQPTPTDQPTPTIIPSVKPTPTSTPTPTTQPTPTNQPSPTPTSEPSNTPTPTAAPTPSITPEITPTSEPSATPTPSVTPTPTLTITPTLQPTPTTQPTAIPTPTTQPTPPSVEQPSPTPTPTILPSPTPEIPLPVWKGPLFNPNSPWLTPLLQSKGVTIPTPTITPPTHLAHIPQVRGIQTEQKSMLARFITMLQEFFERTTHFLGQVAEKFIPSALGSGRKINKILYNQPLSRIEDTTGICKRYCGL